DGNAALFDGHELLGVQCIKVLPHSHSRQCQPVCQLCRRQRTFRFQKMNQCATSLSVFGFSKLSNHTLYLNIFLYKVNWEGYSDFVKLFLYKVLKGAYP